MVVFKTLLKPPGDSGCGFLSDRLRSGEIMNTEENEFERIEREIKLRAVPDVIPHTDPAESLEYITGWNDCRAAMLAKQPAQQEPDWGALAEKRLASVTTLIEMAQSVGAGEPASLYGRTDYIVFTKSELGSFAELVRADERARMAEQPAQQEPGLLERDQCDRLVALVMSKLASKHSLATLPGELNPNIMTHHALRHSIVQAAFMAGAVSATPQAQRTWVGLTDEEVEGYWDWEDFQCGCGRGTLFEMVLDIEAKLKEKNT